MELALLQNYVMPVSIPLFILIYALAYTFLFSSWKGNARYEASSCTMSMLHGTITALFSAYHLCTTPWKLDAKNTALEDALMSFSISYFIVDLFHYFLFVPGDFKFILHHLATSMYMISCKYYTKHGGLSVIALMGLGEVSSPLQSMWTISRFGQTVSPVAKAFYEASSLPFTLLFTFTRGFLGPILTWNLCRFYLSNRAGHVIPYWIATFWMALVIIGMSGSMMWLRSLWAGLRKFNAKKKNMGSSSSSSSSSITIKLNGIKHK